jgi:hypothetical protein
LESMAVDAEGRKIDHGSTGMESRICVSFGNQNGCEWIFDNQALLPNALLWTTVFSFLRCRSKIVRECRRESGKRSMFQRLSGTIPPSSRNKMQLLQPLCKWNRNVDARTSMQGEVHDVDGSFIGCLFGSASSNHVREPSRMNPCIHRAPEAKSGLEWGSRPQWSERCIRCRRRLMVQCLRCAGALCWAVVQWWFRLRRRSHERNT